MFETFVAFLQSTKEWQGFGLNSLTLQFCFILGECSLLFWGRTKQLETLWHPSVTTMRDIDGMSMTKELFVLAFYFIAFNYGVALKSIALMLALPLGIADASIVTRLLKLKRLTWWEWMVMFVSFGLIAVSFLTHWEAEVYGIISTALVFPLAAQPLEMWKRKSARGLNPRVPITGLISTGVWIFYSLTIGSWMIAGFSAAYFIIYAFTFFLWRIFTPRGN